MGLITSSWIWDFILVIVILAPLIFIKIRNFLSIFKKADVPLMPLWDTIVINLNLLMQKTSFNDATDRVYNMYPNAKAVGFFQFVLPGIMIRDPDQIELILKKDFSSFHDHNPKLTDLDLNPLDGHLFNMSGAQWRALRNKLSPTFTSGKLKWMMGLIEEISNNLINVLNAQPKGEDMLIRDFISRFTIDVIASCAFGVDSGALQNPNCEFIRMSKRVFRPTKVEMFKTILRFLTPNLSKFFRIRVFEKEVSDFFFSLTKQAFEHRLKMGEKRGDFLELLLQLREKGEIQLDERDLGYDDVDIASSKLVMTDELLTAQSFIFLVAGWENSATVISFTLYFLAKYKEFQDQVREEVKETLSRHNGHITYDALKEMTFLNACISETFRLYPPLGSMFRRCTKTYKLQSGGIIEKGVMISIPSASLQKNPAYFPDPEKFDPYRFLNGDHFHPATYMPFGDGPRVCIAQRFAMIEMKHVLVKLVENFEFEQSPKMKEPIRLDPSMFLMNPEGGMWLRLKKISSK